jgi:hypothetical protein
VIVPFDPGAVLAFLAQLVLLAIALICGIRSLLLLRSPGRAVGLKLAWIALGLCAAVGAWRVLFFPPWRFPADRPLLWMPFGPLAVAASAAALWAMRGPRLSGTVRLMTIVAVIALTIAGGISLQRWDLRRERLYWIGFEEADAAKFLAASRAEERCQEHRRRGERCGRCKNAYPDPHGYYAKELRKYAEEAAERAKAWRRRTDDR